MPITSRFGPFTDALEVVDGVDLSGRVAVVTGGASGIGIETARALAVAGADVTIATRNTTAAGLVVDGLLTENPGAAVHVLSLDLASVRSTRDAATTFLDRGVALDILVNNAGVMATPHEHTSDGFELQFGTNHLGHFAFTVSLLPALRRASGARVVALSSVAHRRSDVVVDDPNFEHRPYERWAAYGQSKTANALFAVALTEHFGDDGIFSNAVMPGGILTGLQKHLSRVEQTELGWLDAEGKPNARFKTPAQGASTSIWAAVAPELQGIGGRYLENCSEAAPMEKDTPFLGYMPYALDTDNAARVWDLSERLLVET